MRIIGLISYSVRINITSAGIPMVTIRRFRFIPCVIGRLKGVSVTHTSLLFPGGILFGSFGTWLVQGLQFLVLLLESFSEFEDVFLGFFQERLVCLGCLGIMAVMA